MTIRTNGDQNRITIEEINRELDTNDNGLVIACETPRDASTLTRLLYEETDATYHIEHYPVTDDEIGAIEYIALLIRRLTYDRDVGWTSADIPDTPDIDLRTRCGSDTTHVDEPSKRRFAVAAETVNDPYHNYTLLGHIIELDLAEYNSVQDAAYDAAETAVEIMPESINDLIDTEFKVLIIEDSTWVPVKELV